ncbi:hypothetical protein K456DRAFT_1355641 [Colletotrichum gloeosporioides 23]|nr:hypothetical protein K456DRAFT_1355641 [Colletotrichum gloeosporioides 23]
MTLKKSCLDLFLVWCFFLGCRPTRNQGAGTGRHGTKKKKREETKGKKFLLERHFALLDPSLIDRSRGKKSVFFWAWFLFRAIGWFPVPSAALRSGRSTVTAQIRETMGFIVVGKGIGHLLCWEEQRQTTQNGHTHTQVALLMMGNTDTDTDLGIGKGGGNTRIHAHTQRKQPFWNLLGLLLVGHLFLRGGSGESVILSTAGSWFRARHCAYGTAHDF